MKAKKFLTAVLAFAALLACMGVTAMAAGATAVAKIGETSYETLQAAFDAAVDGDVIEVQGNITFTLSNCGSNSGSYVDGVRYTGDASFTVDFNGYTVTDDGCVNDYVIYTNNKGAKANEITFMNGTVTSKDGCWATVCFNSSAATQNTTLHLNGMKIENKNGVSYPGNDAVRVRASSATQTILNVNEGTVLTSDNASYGVGGHSKNTIINVNSGAKVEQKNSANVGGNHTCAAASTLGVLNVYEGAEIVSDHNGIHPMTSANPVVNIYGGTISGDNAALSAVTNGADGQSVTFNVYGGTITGDLYKANTDGKYSIAGGTFTTNVSDYVAYGSSYNAATGEVAASAASAWTTATDAGSYVVGDTTYGMMRFLFAAEVEGEVTASGIMYIKGKEITTQVGERETGSSNAFYGDIVGIGEGIEGTYYAVAYITTAEGTVWSDPLSCTINWTKQFTNYAGGAQ